MSSEIGIMQGRLSPPFADKFQAFPGDSWEEEFPRATEAGLQAIEWIYDLADAESNPIANDTGVEKMRWLSEHYGVKVQSLCADYFMARPLLRVSDAERKERLKKIEWLLHRCKLAGIQRVVLPFVDASRIENQTDHVMVIDGLRHISPVLDRLDVEIHLETALNPEDFNSLLVAIGHPRIKVNYDSGNSASLGYDPRIEWQTYGHKVGSVHIKDRVRGGGTVPLGTGDTNFEGLFAGIVACGYSGPWILQAARGSNGEEVKWARQNRAFLQHWLDRTR